MIIREKVRIGDQVVTLETGRIAKQAGGSCLVRAGDTMVLVTVCGNREPKAGQNFFPLSVDYIEKTYAAGKIPGGFFKREGKLRDYEVLTSRLIDRPCRPLFPEGYMADVQIVATVLSFDNENPADTLAILGASAALHISEIPWSGPIGGVRVGRIDGEFIANPTYKQLRESDCDLILAASRDAIVMVEGEAEEMPEEDMIDALLFGHRAIQDSLELVQRMRGAVGKPKWTFASDQTPLLLKDRVAQVAGYKVREACSIADKHLRYDRFKQIKKELVETLAPEFLGKEEALKKCYEELHYHTLRNQVLDEGRRVDGRDTKTVRPISIELGVLPRTHGSTLFTRGETQAIVTTTLGTSRDEQRIDMLTGDIHKNFLLHYNFPPYSVGEVKMMRGVGRREVGHGNLAERALAKMIPEKAAFPYTIRLVSEITESNGSSSMASVCGGALALMDAGVPIKAPVAGVAMGLIKEGERYAVLTDILGDEDHLGDMDFKVCGTERGVTAIQMDIKIDGLSREILERALHQARDGRLFILDKMRQALSGARDDLSRWAPRITQIRVKPDQVRTIIGPGGKMIRAICDQTGASIDVEDDGTVSVSSADSAAVTKALEIIKSLTTEPEIGEIYEGTVKRIEPYGAFIEILPGKDGLCHISDIDASHVQSVEDFMNLGDKVSVKITNIDRDGRIRLSRKEAMTEVAPSKLNGRTEVRPVRDERQSREERTVREERPRFRDEKPAIDAREERLAREERPARGERPVREDRPTSGERPRFRDEKPMTEAREGRPAREDRPTRLERLHPRDLKTTLEPREERPAREEQPRFRDDERPSRARDEVRDSGPVRDVRPPRVRDELRAERPIRTRDDVREERPIRARDDVREERPIRARDDVREERPTRFRDERPSRAREELREERPVRMRDELREESPIRAKEELRGARVRDEAPAPRAREERPVRDERPSRAREERPVREDLREERPVRAREELREERPVSVRAREELREERPVRAREELREERPVRAREELREERPVRAREELREERSLRERPARSREELREERPLPARARDFEREERAAPQGRGFERDERPAARGRDERAEREERTTRGRDLERDERPAGRAREERPAPRGRDSERDERPAPKARDFDRDERPAARGRDFDRDERPAARGREFDHDAKPALRDPESVDRKPVRGRDRIDEPRADERVSARAPRDDEFAPKATLLREREERTERERPSRTRARARTRERIREDERERR